MKPTGPVLLTALVLGYYSAPSAAAAPCEVLGVAGGLVVARVYGNEIRGPDNVVIGKISGDKIYWGSHSVEKRDYALVVRGTVGSTTKGKGMYRVESFRVRHTSQGPAVPSGWSMIRFLPSNSVIARSRNCTNIQAIGGAAAGEARRGMRADAPTSARERQTPKPPHTGSEDWCQVEMKDFRWYHEVRCIHVNYSGCREATRTSLADDHCEKREEYYKECKEYPKYCY